MKSSKIKLRALEPSDSELLYEWENDPSTWHVSNTIAPFSKFDIEQYIMSSEKDISINKQLRFMIDKILHDNKLKTVGSIDIFDYDALNRKAGIGILIIEGERNKGLASDALDILIKYGFETLNLHQFYCNISSDNKVSLKLFEKKNFQLIGNKKEWKYKKGKYHDEWILQLINK